MNKALIAYLAIDEIVRDCGVHPLEEGVGACWNAESENRGRRYPPGAEIYADAVEYADDGVTFRWALGFARVRKGEYDAVAALEFGITVPSPEGDGPDAYPTLKIEYRNSAGAWTARFDPWDGGMKEISAVVKMLGLEISADGFGPREPRTIGERAARTAIAALARHVKESYIE